MLQDIWNKVWSREPVLFLGLVQAVITVVTVFGVDLTTEQVAAINLLTVAILSFIARSQVSPVAK